MDVKENRRFFSGIGFCYFLLAIIWLVGSAVLAAVLTKINPNLAGRTMTRLLISDGILYFVAAPIFIKLMQRFPAMNIRQCKITPGRWITFAFIAFFIMYSGNIIGMIVNKVISLFTGTAPESAIDLVLGDMSLGWIFLLVVVAAPIVEELIFRKILIDRAIVYGDKAAIILSGLLFGLFHGNFSQFFYAFGLGMLLAYIYIRSGNILYSIGLHMLINFMGGFLSSALMKNLGIEQILDYALQPELLGEYVMSHIGVWMALFVFVLCVIACFIVGLVLFIIKFKHRVLLPGEYTLPKKTQASVMLLNIGMLLFYIVMGYSFVRGFLS